MDGWVPEIQQADRYEDQYARHIQRKMEEISAVTFGEWWAIGYEGVDEMWRQAAGKSGDSALTMDSNLNGLSQIK